jgi:hypothetical protein
MMGIALPKNMRILETTKNTIGKQGEFPIRCSLFAARLHVVCSTLSLIPGSGPFF